MINGEKVCVTGGSGFIGQNLIRALLAKGCDVVVFDIKSPPFDGVRFVHGDVMDQQALNKALQGARFVFHLASPVGVRETEKAGSATFDTIILGTNNVLDACRAHGVEKLFFSSSSEVYGDVEGVGAREDDQLKPKSDYGKGKMVAEELIREAAQKGGPRYVMARYFSVYGPGQRPEFVVPKFVHAACRNEPLHIYGDGEQIRAFGYVSDIVDGTLNAFEKTTNELFNIGNDQEEITIKELAGRIKQIANSESEIRHLPLEQTDRTAEREIYRRLPDISKLKAMTGFKPNVSLTEGIGHTVNHVKSTLV